LAKATARVSRKINAPVDVVWQALTTPDLVGSFFFGATVESDFRVGSPIRFKGEFKGKSYEDKGEILAVDTRHHLSFSHYSPLSGAPDKPENYHVVSFDLAGDATGTMVVLTQSNLRGDVKASDVEHKAEYEKNWSAVLEGLSKVVEL
jgi:uncharacterized protein YndB with AHSA1/START domain